MTVETSYRICPLCEACCGLEVTHEEGRVLSVRGADADPFSEGYICPKGVAIADLHDDPDRLRTPMIRRNGRFEAATWDEAFAEIERGLMPVIERHGREAVGAVLGNPVSHRYGINLFSQRFLRALGTPNIFSSSTVDQMPKHRAVGEMFGNWMSVSVPDISRTGLLVILGANPMASNGSLWTVPDFRGKARALRARGGRIVTIDPRRTETARVSDEHLFIRPGGDVFLLLGLTHTLFAEGLVKTGRLGEFLNGLDALEAAVAPYDAERMAPHCGIAATEIRRLARALASTERAALYGRIGTCVQAFGTLNNWLIDVVNILTGHMDEPGGMMFPKAAAFAANTRGKPGSGRGVKVGRRTMKSAPVPEIMSEFPVSAIADEITGAGEHGIRAMFTVAANPVLSAPNGEKLSKALDTLDFMVSLDIYINETTRHANVILPGLSPLEDSHWDVVFNQFAWRNTARYSPATFPVEDGRLTEWQALMRLTGLVQGRGTNVDPAALDEEMTRAEVEKLAGPMTEQVMQSVTGLAGPDRLVELELRGGPYGDGFGRNPAGLTLAKVKAERYGIDLGLHEPRVPEILRTPSGRIELAPPDFVADLARVDAALREPVADLVLIGRRDVRTNNSWMHNLPTLAKGPNRCKLLVHPADAARHGLSQGGLAEIAGNGATLLVPVEITEDMMPGVVSLPHGWGHDRQGAELKIAALNPGVNVNALISEGARDPLSGNSVLNGVAISLKAAALQVVEAAE
jgi:anaerobic selenocysteine-containing dehydrogenase